MTLNFFPASIKNDNGSFAMRNIFVRRKRNQKLHQFLKGWRKDIEDFLNCALTFLFLISIKVKDFLVTQNDTPKMVKIVRLY